MKKLKQILRKLTVLSLLLSMMIIPTVSVHADANPNALQYLFDVDMSTGEMTNKMEQTLKDNYWVDLEKKNVKNVTVPHDPADDNMVGVFPKYITSPSDTAINPIVAFHGLKLDPINYFPNTGIRLNGHTLETAYYWSFIGSDYKQLPTESWRNPYNFKQDEILTADEVANPDEKLSVYGDLYAKGSKDSTAIDSYDKGMEIPLEFSVNASWFKRYLKGFTLEMFGGGGTTLQNIDKRAGMFAISDAGLAFTIDVPEGVTVEDNPKIKIEGLDGFSAKTSKEDGKLVIRLSKDEKAKKYKWKDLLEKVSSVKADNILVSISGVKVADSAAPDAQITLKGTAAGFYDFALSETEEFHSFSANHTDDAAQRLYTFFAARQSDAGRDKATPADKPNLISYTFKVNKPANNTVTFKNGEDTYASVKVENGKAIDSDSLADESMPQNPIKNGYTFKEWNTQKDGKGTKFTGDTTVNQDITVYAIYSLNMAPIETPPTLELRDKTITVGEELDERDLIVKAEDRNGKDLRNAIELVDNGGFDNTKAGKYTFTFKITDKNGISVTKKAVVTVKEKDKPTPNPNNNKPTPKPDNKPQIPNTKTLPKTGDSVNITLYAVLMGLSGALLVAVGLRKRRKES